MRVVIVSGLAGGGKTTALRAIEDLGFFCCDNLPIPLIGSFVAGLVREGHNDCAVSVDGRQLNYIDEYHRQIEALRAEGHEIQVLFLEAPDAVLTRRYSETRRRHPLSHDDVVEGIRQDREALASLRERATLINTGGLNVHELKKLVTHFFTNEDTSLSVGLQSFGFKYGLPSESELVFDVRHLPNPHFDPVLGPQDGRDADVAAYVFAATEAAETVTMIHEYLRFSLPLYAREGKLYVRIGIGCTGGRHRSVAVTEELARRLGDEDWHVLLRHRDVLRGTTRSLDG